MKNYMVWLSVVMLATFGALGGFDSGNSTEAVVEAGLEPLEYYLSSVGTATAPGVGTVRNEDNFYFNPITKTRALYLDGSDLGLEASAYKVLAAANTMSNEFPDSSVFSD